MYQQVFVLSWSFFFFFLLKKKTVFVPHPRIFPGLLSKQLSIILEENHDICIT